MNRTATSAVRLRRNDGEGMFRALRYLEKLSTIIRFPGKRHDLSRSGKPAHRVERLQRQAPAMRLVSTVIVLVLTSALHQPRSPWHQDAKVVSPCDGTICEGEFGAAPLSSEIGLTRDGGYRAPRPIGRAPTPDPQQPRLFSAQPRVAPRCRRQTDLLRLTLYCALTRMFQGVSTVTFGQQRDTPSKTPTCSTRTTTIPQFRV
jgi:hypothetical protein